MVDKNLFRKDLYARISTFELHIKPLRERKRDIVPIVITLGDLLKMPIKAKEFIAKYEEAMMNSEIDLSLNVRSLEQALKRYSVLGKI
jgi:DNA-binding NtrC family response regulator